MKKYRICVNGEYRDATEEEAAEIEAKRQNAPPFPIQKPNNAAAIWDELAAAYKEGVNSLDE